MQTRPIISDLVQVGIGMSKYRHEAEPLNGVQDEDLSLQAEIREKLGWSASDQSISYSLPTLLDRIALAGIADPNSFLNLEEAARLSGFNERELWKLIAQGKLVLSDAGSGRAGTRLYVPSLFRVVLEFERLNQMPASTSELMGREVVNLCTMIAEQQKSAVRRADELIDLFRRQTEMFEAIRVEQRETMDEMLRFTGWISTTCQPKRGARPWKGLFSLR